jgi:hypothetical protein
MFKPPNKLLFHSLPSGYFLFTPTGIELLVQPADCCGKDQQEWPQGTQHFHSNVFNCVHFEYDTGNSLQTNLLILHGPRARHPERLADFQGFLESLSVWFRNEIIQNAA